jgi:hypothetical protein
MLEFGDLELLSLHQRTEFGQSVRFIHEGFSSADGWCIQ